MKLWVVAFLCAVAVAQEAKVEKEKPPPKKTAGEVEIEGAGVKIEDASSARREVTRFEKRMKESRKDYLKRIELLKKLGEWDHAMVFKAAKKYVYDKEHLVAVAAVVTCARQTSAKAKVGKFLLGALRKEKRNHVRCALLVGMGVIGYDKKSAKSEAYNFFRRDTKETHKAATRYLGYIKDKSAFRMLAERLDEPVSKSPNSPTNPPASWWRERWMEWDTNKKWTRWALAQMVPGETFDAREEAKAWAKAEGKKHGIEW